MAGKHTVAVVGSGNWGTAIAKIVGENVAQHSDVFNKDVKMWVFEEEVEHEGKKRPLTEVINEKHENVKYLPNIALPEGIIAEPDIVKTVEGANILIFNLPHQFVGKVCKQLRESGKVSKDAVGISCIKGVEISKDDISLFPYTIGEELGIYVGALSGANIANEVAEEKFCETTIAYAPKDDKGVSSDTIKKLFHREYFRVGMCEDVAGVSLAGALKNVVAVAAGFADGLGWGDNSKAAVMRVGLMEMKKFAKTFFPDVRSATFTEESCGIADLITSCLGGRNRRCAEAFVKTGKSMDELEQEMLNGQKLQGAGTAEEVFHFLDKKGKTDDFKLFTAVYKIVYQGLPPDQLTDNI